MGKHLVGLMTRDSYHVISSIGYHWDYYVSFTRGAKRELLWWVNNKEAINTRGRYVRPSPSLTLLDHELAGDASGVGLYLMQASGDRRTLFLESLTAEEAEGSSTLRKILVFHWFYCSEQAARYRG